MAPSDPDKAAWGFRPWCVMLSWHLWNNNWSIDWAASLCRALCLPLDLLNTHLHLWDSRTISILQMREQRIRGWERARSHGKYLPSLEFELRPVWLQKVYFTFFNYLRKENLKACLQIRCFSQIRQKSTKLNSYYRQMNKIVFYNFPIFILSSLSLSEFCVLNLFLTQLNILTERFPKFIL